ncbi:hypothetical protein P43SY_010183 [Pythium insidiosum]|uniref:Nuclear cap-binding protein subunit n=1 Tax=Pythium insidiosum TaxID=114742 RepID=A0AAD5LRW4_PYTIN|nr:hypothetical protein P43SY_010183 [Pythium insidiosum]
MYRGGGGSYNGDDRSGYKRSYDDDYNGDDRGGYKRSRLDSGRDNGSYYRPRGGNGNYGGDRSRYGQSSNNYASERRPSESDRARAWRLAKKALVELGEDSTTCEQLRGSALREQLEATARRVQEELAQHEDPTIACTHLAQLVVRGGGRLPHKTSLYATVVGLVNESHRAFGQEVVALATRELRGDLAFFHRSADDAEDIDNDEDALRQAKDVNGVALRLRLTLRLLAELVSTRVVKAEDLLMWLDALQSACTPEDFAALDNDDGSDSERMSLRQREHRAAFKDFIASTVLDALLHAGQALAVGCEDLYESLLTRCREYILAREEESNPRGVDSGHAANWLERRLRLDLLWEPEQEDELLVACKKSDLLSLEWDALNLTRAEAQPVVGSDMNPHLRWKIPGVLYPQELLERHFVGTEPHSLDAAPSIDLTALNETRVPRYDLVFRILGEESGAVGAPLANLHLASYLITRGHLSDAIESFSPKPSVAAKHLIALTRSYNLRFADADVAGLKAEYILLEALLTKALTATTTARLGYLCCVLTQLVKVDARLVSPALAIVVELLFREIPVMSAQATDALVKLLSHFLSNFEYKWVWSRWAHVVEAQEDDTQRLFVSAVLERCVRLSYLQHMQTVLPAEMHALLPPEPKPRVLYAGDAAAPTPENEDDENAITPAAKAFFEAVAAKLKTHPTTAEFCSWIDEESEATAVPAETARDAVLTAILESGAATFTHSRLMLEKYGHLSTSRLFQGEEGELAIVRAVGSVWIKSPQHIGLLLNMMLRLRIIQAATIAQWVFTSDAIQQYSWPYVWGILDDTMTFLQSMKAETAATGSDDVAMKDEDERDAASELREVLKTVFVGLNRVVTEHKSNCDADGVSHRDNWFHSALAQLKAIGAKFRDELEDVVDELQRDVFLGSAADHDVKKGFDFVRDSYRSA